MHKQESARGTWPLLLLVDDDPVMSLVFRQYFERLGYRVIEAQDGAMGLALFQERLPDMVLLDAEMPVMDGFQTCAAIRRLSVGMRVPIIMVTAHHDESSVDRAFSCGASDYITKPVNWAVFRHRTQSILRARQVEQALLAERALSQLAAEEIAEGYLRTDAVGQVQSTNQAAERLLRVPREQMLGRSLFSLLRFLEPVANRDLTDLAGLIEAHKSGVLQAQRIDDDAATMPFEFGLAYQRANDGSIINFVATFRDVGEERRLSNKLAHHASHDALTGLLKRREFERRMSVFGVANDNVIPRCALIYIDLDRLKLLNECCGHSAGDEALRHVAGLLEIKTHTKALLGRIGGDEFGVFLPDCTGAEAHVIANQLCEAISDNSFSSDGVPFPIGAHAGVVESVSANDAAALLATGAKAVTLAKQSGTRVYWLRDRPGDIAVADGAWRERIVGALAADRFELLAQPIVALSVSATMQLSEIFVRLLDADGARILPGHFFPAAGRYGIAKAIDRWVIRRALTWLASGSGDAGVMHIASINLTADSVSDDRFVGYVRSELERHNIAPDRLCFEIAESTLMDDSRPAIRVARALKELGCLIAIDDFGGGVAVVNTLRGMTVDFVKIDGAWVRSMHDDAVGRTMVQSLNDVGHELGAKTIAEFVENGLVLQSVRELGVDYAQGYGINRPVAITSCKDLNAIIGD